MRQHLLALSLLVTTAASQDLVYYKFNSACTTEVINYATGPQAFGNGTLQSNSTASPFITGRFDGGLAGGSNATPGFYNRVLTGWNPATQPLTGSLTMAWFMRLRSGATISTALNYVLGAPSGGIRLFTNGAAGTGLIHREILAGGGAPTVRDFQLPAATFDVQAAAALAWVHIAIVVDATAQTADWFVNGTSVLQRTGVPGANMSLAGPFMLGAYSTATTGAGSVYEMDEFLLSNRAYAPAEILALATAPRGADGDYTSGIATQCGSGNVILGSVGGAPAAGNPGYGLQVSTATPSVFLLLAGFDRCQFGGTTPLPLDGTPLLPLLAGCWILADAPLIVNGLAAAGPVVVPLALPATAPFATTIYTQVLSLDIATSAASMSNGFASAIGF